MIKYFYLVIVCFALLETTAGAGPNLAGTTYVGWSGIGGDETGIPCEAKDIWTSRANWHDVEAVGYPASNTQIKPYVASNPTGVVDFAIALIPHSMPTSTWNTSLDEVAAGEHDSSFVIVGQNLAKYGTTHTVCRPWWEMTINAKPIDPTKFKAAWNHAIPIIRRSFAAAAPNKHLYVAFCYLPDTADPTPYFPDPANFDVVDADIYLKTWGKTTPSQASMLAAVQKDLDQLETFATEKNKPAGVSEWANVAIQTQGVTTNQGRGDDPEAINLMLDYGAQHHFMYMVYYNIAIGGVNQTFANIPLSLAAFRTALTTAAYTTSTPPTVSAPTGGTTSSGGTSSGSTTSSGGTSSGSTTSSGGTSSGGTSSGGTSSGSTTSSGGTSSGSTTSSGGASTADTTPQPTTFAAWQSKYFTAAQIADTDISGPTADPFGSGIPNLLAYALGLDPATARPTDVPQATLGDGHLTMSYLVPSALTDIVFVPEVSSDLKTWESGTSVIETISTVTGASGKTITVQDTLPTTTKKHFMRLRVTQQ